MSHSRPTCVALVLAFVCVFNPQAFAQDFPRRPVTVIVPFPPGGSSDGMMRALAKATEKHLGQTIVIETRLAEMARLRRRKWPLSLSRTGTHLRKL